MTKFISRITQRGYSSTRTFLPGVIRILLIGSLSLMAASYFVEVAQASSGNKKPTQVSATPQTQENRIAMFNQAVANDLAGRPTAARRAYDTLKGTELDSQIAVPSAVNFVALGRFAEASKAFDALTLSPNVRDRDYARLWQLWLNARTGQKAHGNKKDTVGAISLAQPNEQAIANLYTGKGSVEAVFSAVKAMSFTTELERSDALTEATFFTGTWLLYVKHDNAAAKNLFDQNRSQLNNVSLETPFITKEMAAL
ncbi:hypothetical protein FH968_10780 [Buttiauxella sp. B2]|uniref:hypothetical protein n=1 Tax=Buttiauxella sp. B2 TaxID=2587812 RepID=UPI0011246F73|nr:hypothetical protein [Buttiauxella sp. B2]TNV20479.1 hypothetical protein FH968_10780 [Buttiauxella sp. B2]